MFVSSELLVRFGLFVRSELFSIQCRFWSLNCLLLVFFWLFVSLIVLHIIYRFSVSSCLWIPSYTSVFSCLWIFGLSVSFGLTVSGHVTPLSRFLVLGRLSVICIRDKVKCWKSAIATFKCKIDEYCVRTKAVACNLVFNTKKEDTRSG